MEYWLRVSIALYHRMKYIKIVSSRIEVVYQNIFLRKGLGLRCINYFNFIVLINLILKLLIIFYFFYYRMLGYPILIYLSYRWHTGAGGGGESSLIIFSFDVIYLILIFEQCYLIQLDNSYFYIILFFYLWCW